MNVIQWMPRAAKQVRKLQRKTAKEIMDAVGEELVDLNAARNVKRLTNHQYGYRLRVGNYRVFFEFDGGVRIVTIEEVRKRDGQTY